VERTVYRTAPDCPGALRVFPTRLGTCQSAVPQTGQFGFGRSRHGCRYGSIADQPLGDVVLRKKFVRCEIALR